MTMRIMSTWLLVAGVLLAPAFAQELVSERQAITEAVLESDYFDEYMARLEDQHSDFHIWFPADRLNKATILSFLEFEDGVVFVCFSQQADYYRGDSGPYRIVVPGPAVVFPVFPDDGEAKFKNNRYVGVVKKADWSKRDRHFWDEDVSISFSHTTGGHKRLVRVQQFDISDTLVGEKDLDDDGNDKRMTDRQQLARLMGVYYPGP